MASAKRSRSYIVRLLRVLHESGEPLSKDELMEALKNQFSEPELLRWQRVNPINVDETLRELSELGVVQSVVKTDGSAAWMIGSSERGTSFASGNTGFAALVSQRLGAEAGRAEQAVPAVGGGGGDGSSTGGSGTDDPSGDGLREVLDHDVLFCIDDDDFEAAVAACVERY